MVLNLIFLGAPGAGKGTVSEAVKDKFGLVQISTGDLVRAEIKAGTALGEKIKYYSSKGLLVPDEIIAKMFEARLLEVSSRPNFRGAIFDGFPRNAKQIGLFEKAMKKSGQKVTAVLNLEVSEKDVIKRLSARRVCPHCKATYNLVSQKPKKEGVCDKDGVKLIQRPDDTPKVIKDRMKIFRKETAPLVKHYAAKGVLHSYNASVPLVDSIKAAEAAIGRIAAAGKLVTAAKRNVARRARVAPKRIISVRGRRK